MFGYQAFECLIFAGKCKAFVSLTTSELFLLAAWMKSQPRYADGAEVALFLAKDSEVMGMPEVTFTNPDFSRV